MLCFVQPRCSGATGEWPELSEQQTAVRDSVQEQLLSRCHPPAVKGHRDNLACSTSTVCADLNCGIAELAVSVVAGVVLVCRWQACMHCSVCSSDVQQH